VTADVVVLRSWLIRAAPIHDVAGSSLAERKPPSPSWVGTQESLTVWNPGLCGCKETQCSSGQQLSPLRCWPLIRSRRRNEDDPVATVHENFVACEVLSQLQRVVENPRFLLAGECVPLRARERVRVYASRGPYACIYPHDTIAPCKWAHQKVLSK
jgi:hypothetical protein